MIVVDIGKNIGVTLSNNHFQGSTPWSSTCLGSVPVTSTWWHRTASFLGHSINHYHTFSIADKTCAPENTTGLSF